MYRHNPSLDVDGFLLDTIVDHCIESISTLLRLIPATKKETPLHKIRGLEAKLAADTYEDFGFVMPYDNKRSTVSAILQIKGLSSSKLRFDKAMKKPPAPKFMSGGRMARFLFPGAMETESSLKAYREQRARGITRKFNLTQSGVSFTVGDSRVYEGWHHYYKHLTLWVNPYCTTDQISTFLWIIQDMGGFEYDKFRLYILALMAHELTHAYDAELLYDDSGACSADIDRERYHSDFDYYYNCDTEVRANQNAAYWVMEEMKLISPEWINQTVGNKDMYTNLQNLSRIAPSIGAAASTPRTKKVFTDEIKLFQKANKELFPSLFPTKRKPVKRKRK